MIRLIVLALGFVLLGSCIATRVSIAGLEKYPYGEFQVDTITYNIRTEPYRNGMPGANGDDVIIPITISIKRKSYYPWNTRFKFIRIKLHYNGDVYYSGSCFDHDEWTINDAQSPTGNTLRLPHEKVPYKFDATIWFKDENGKRYKYTARNLTVGWVD